MNQQERDQFLEIFLELPKKARSAVYWMVENIDLVNALTEEGRYTEQEIEAMVSKAYERDDYLMAALLYYKQARDKGKKQG